MREKLIDIVEWYADFLDWDTKEDMVDGIMDFLATDNNVGDKASPTGWIPVSERLPEKFGEYLVAVKEGTGERYSDYADFDLYQQKWKPGLFLGVHDAITHWMPLPQPPKEG